MARSPIPLVVQEAVLTKSARRCALCFGFDGIFARKEGQLAHVDQDHANSTEDNLAFLCLEHHNEYDSKPSQSKGLTERELRNYRNRLYEAIASGAHHEAPPPRLSPEHLAHETQVFLKGDELLSEADVRGILDSVASDHSYRQEEYGRVLAFLRHFSLESHGYVTGDLRSVGGNALDALDRLVGFLAKHFFVFPDRQPSSPEGQKYCMYPDLNSDRGAFTPEGDARYRTYSEELRLVVDEVDAAFSEYRRTIKRTLLR